MVKFRFNQLMMGYALDALMDSLHTKSDDFVVNSSITDKYIRFKWAQRTALVNVRFNGCVKLWISPRSMRSLADAYPRSNGYTSYGLGIINIEKGYLRTAIVTVPVKVEFFRKASS